MKPIGFAFACLLALAGTFSLAFSGAQAGGWGSVPRTYVMCTQDMTIRPALQQRFITDADAAFPASPTSVHTLNAGHSPFLSMPGQVADIVVKLRR